MHRTQGSFYNSNEVKSRQIQIKWKICSQKLNEVKNKKNPLEPRDLGSFNKPTGRDLVQKTKVHMNLKKILVHLKTHHRRFICTNESRQQRFI